MFLFSLAAELHMSVRQLTDTVDSRELSEWMVYYKLKNDEWEKTHPKSPTKAATPEQLSNELKAALGGFKRSGVK